MPDSRVHVDCVLHGYPQQLRNPHNRDERLNLASKMLQTKLNPTHKPLMDPSLKP